MKSWINNSGTLVLRAQSPNLEKFINILWNNKIGVKYINKKNINTVELEIKLGDYMEVRKAAEATRTKIRIIDRKGKAFFFIHHRHRKALLAGMIIFLCIIYYLSTYIWSVNIYTESNISPYEIRMMLNKKEIIKGIKKKDLKLKEIEEMLIRENNEIAWVKAYLDGTSLNIKIVEKQNPPEIVDENTPCKLVAKRDGEIMRVYTKAGTAVVKEGDIVKKGDVVVEGIQGSEGHKYFVHSEGSAIARTFYEKKSKVDIVKKSRVRTGNVKSQIYFNIAGKKFFLRNDLNNFVNYDKIIDDKSFIKKVKYFEVEEKEDRIYNVEEELKRAFEKLEEEIKLNFDRSINVVDTIRDKKKKDNHYEIRVLIVAEEDIAVPMKIDENEILQHENNKVDEEN